MKCTILGAGGKMGEAAVWAAKEVGFETYVYEINEKRREEIIEKYGVNEVKGPVDIVISCAPYHQNLEYAKETIGVGVSWIDLGGDIDTDNAILEHAKKAAKPVHCGAGLAPGFAQIFGEKAIEDLGGQPESVSVMVGGLPKYPDNPIMYNSSWSVDGLLNNYRNRCQSLKDGNIVEKEPFSDYKQIGRLVNDEWYSYFRNDLQLETFITSGGFNPAYLEEIKGRGIKNYSYSTIRYSGHSAIMRWLVKNLSNKELSKLLISKESFADIVLVEVNANKGPLSWKERFKIDCSKNFSAMQRSTAFSLVVCAEIMCKNSLNKILYNYKDFNTLEFYNMYKNLLDKDLSR